MINCTFVGAANNERIFQLGVDCVQPIVAAVVAHAAAAAAAEPLCLYARTLRALARAGRSPGDDWRAMLALFTRSPGIIADVSQII